MQERRWTTKTIAILTSATATVFLPDGMAMAQTPQSDLPAQLVQDLHGAFGDRHARAIHAKGVILQGSFKPSHEGQTLSKSEVFQSPRSVTVRFSDFTGLPDISDASGDANPRGFAVKFNLAGGATYDIVTHSFNGFPVSTSAEFSALLHTQPKSGPTAAKPTALDQYFAAHPRALTFFTTQKPPPESFATAAYYGVNAFFFENASGGKTPVRYRFVPSSGEHYLTPDTLKTRSADYLMTEIGPRVAAQPIEFTWFAQIGQPTDKVDDPSIACESRSNNPAVKRPICTAAPEQNCGS
jgi:catalase